MPSKAKNATDAYLTFELFTPKDDGRPVYITGNFNNWNPRDKTYELKKVKDGKYRLQLPAPFIPEGQALEYKYVKNDWSGEELAPNGLPTQNRKMLVPKGVVFDIVFEWKKNPGNYAPEFFPDIRIVSDAFNMPQLGKKRRISVLLPHNYEENKSKYYPVIYLQDGQNLFEEGSPYGSWNLDDKLALLSQNGEGEFIVVAIDHGGKDRIEEFLPFDSPKDSMKDKEALGHKYASFLVETLKPYIDQHFRTLADAHNTAIGGSSMGGLISLYAGIQYPHLFSKYLIFSPSLWVSENIFSESVTANWNPNSKMYLYAGANEGEATVLNLLKLAEMMKKSHPNLAYEISMNPKGSHAEAFWGAEFPAAIKWLFGDQINVD